MKYITTSFIVMTCLVVWGQPDRRAEIEKYTCRVYSVTEFRQIACSLQMTIGELSGYPVISPIRGPLRISSGFGMRYHPVHKVWKFHTGIDISMKEGTPVYAAGNGVIVGKGRNPGYGNFIEIRHAGGFRSFYTHLGKTVVNMGDSVRIGEQIACVGNTGLSTGSHLHYEIRKGGHFLNPAEWCFCLYGILEKQILNGKACIGYNAE